MERYRSEEGVLVERFVEDYKTHRAALMELGELRRAAIKILNEGDKVNSEGQKVGPRLQLLFSRSSGVPEHTTIVWVDGAKLFVLRSESETTVLDFEQQDYPAVRAAGAMVKP